MGVSVFPREIHFPIVLSVLRTWSNLTSAPFPTTHSSSPLLFHSSLLHTCREKLYLSSTRHNASPSIWLRLDSTRSLRYSRASRSRGTRETLRNALPEDALLRSGFRIATREISLCFAFYLYLFICLFFNYFFLSFIIYIYIVRVELNFAPSKIVLRYIYRF